MRFISTNMISQQRFEPSTFEELRLKNIHRIPWIIRQSRYKRLFGDHYTKRPINSRIDAYYHPASVITKDGRCWPYVFFIRKEIAAKENPHLKWIRKNDMDTVAESEVQPDDIATITNFPDRIPEKFREQIVEIGMTAKEAISFILTMKDGSSYSYWGPYAHDGPSELDFITLPDGHRLIDMECIKFLDTPPPSDLKRVHYPSQAEIMRCYY